MFFGVFRYAIDENGRKVKCDCDRGLYGVLNDFLVLVIWFEQMIRLE